PLADGGREHDRRGATGIVDGCENLPDVSPAARAQEQLRQSTVRRRAADVGDWTGADAQSARAAAGRAHRGAGADHCRGVALGAAHHHSCRRHLLHYRRAECAKDPRARRPRRDIGAWRDRARCDGRSAEGRSRRAGALSRRGRRYRRQGETLTGVQYNLTILECDPFGSATMLRTIPPFRADEVGSLLRPSKIKEARAKLGKGKISAEDLRKIEDMEIEKVV